VDVEVVRHVAHCHQVTRSGSLVAAHSTAYNRAENMLSILYSKALKSGCSVKARSLHPSASPEERMFHRMSVILKRPIDELLR